MPVFMDDIATIEHVRIGINSCARTEKENKISFCLQKIQYTMVKTGR